jgi:Flp pilus assembly protein TadG
MMRPAIRSQRRRGAAAVEFAFAGPIVFFLLLATMIGSQGVFRYHQVAALAREGARWASVHGGQYQKETGEAAATPEDVFNKAILPLATTLRPEHLSYEVTWDESNMPLEVIDDVQTPRGNTVTVAVSYEWFPEMYLIGPINLTSTSTAQMNY